MPTSKEWRLGTVKWAKEIMARRLEDAQATATTQSPNSPTNRRIVQTEPQTPKELLQSRKEWQKVSTAFLEVLSEKLGSVKNARDFAELCETTGILENNILKFAWQPPDFAIGSTAATLTSYANTMGEQRKFQDAKSALTFALLLRPRHVPAWTSMALVCANLTDYSAAVVWADKVLNFKPEPYTGDAWECTDADIPTPEGEQLAAKGLDDPSVIGTSDAIKQLMQSIKDSCQGKT